MDRGETQTHRHYVPQLYIVTNGELSAQSKPVHAYLWPSCIALRLVLTGETVTTCWLLGSRERRGRATSIT